MSVVQQASLLKGLPLAQIFFIRMQEASGMICDAITAKHKTSKKKGTFPLQGFSDKVPNTAPRGDREPAKESLEFAITQVPFETQAIDERVFLPKTLLEDSDQVDGDLIKAATVMSLADLIKRKKELELINNITNATIHSTNSRTLTSDEKFGTGTINPIKTLLTEANTGRLAASSEYDSILFGWTAWVSFVANENVKGNLPNNAYGTVRMEDVVPLIATGAFAQLKNIYVAGGIWDSAGLKEARVGANIMDDDVILFKKAQDIGEGLILPGAFVQVVRDDMQTFEYEDTINLKGKGKYVEQDYSWTPMVLDDVYFRLLKGVSS